MTRRAGRHPRDSLSSLFDLARRVGAEDERKVDLDREGTRHRPQVEVIEGGRPYPDRHLPGARLARRKIHDARRPGAFLFGYRYRSHAPG